MTQLLDFSTQTGISRVLAAPFPIAQFDGIEEDASGQAYSMQGTDTSACSATTLVAETQLNTTFNTPASNRYPQLCHSQSRDVFIACPPPGGANNPFKLFQYNTAGVLKNSVQLDTNGISDVVILELSNHNICVTWYLGSNYFKFAIFDKNLVAIASNANVGAAVPTGTANSFHACVCPFTGQFALFGVNGANLVQYTIYNNDGTLGLGWTTVATLTGAAGAVFGRIGQLSNNNIALAWGSKYATTIGTYYAIFTPAGAAVIAATNLDTTTAGWCELAVLTGFFALATIQTAVSAKAFVFNNAGAQQGATYTKTNASAGNGNPQIKLLADLFNTRFILLAQDGATNFWYMIGLTTAGVNSVINSAITTGTNFAVAIDAAYDRGRMYVVHTYNSSGSLGTFYAVFNLITGALEKNSTAFGSVPTSQNAFHSIAAVGDFCFSALYAQTTTTQLAFMMIKAVKTAIIGGAFTAILANAVGYVKSGQGALNINLLGGSQASVAFDFSATAPHGNKGSVSPYTLSLIGL